MKKKQIENSKARINKRHINIKKDTSSENNYINFTKNYLNLNKIKCKQRQENSLSEITKNFVYYLNNKEEQDIDLAEIVSKLKVKKRRIYDITNVLEGKNYKIYFFILKFNNFKLINRNKILIH